VCVCLGAVLFCLGGFSVCALHGGGSRLLLHYQLFRKPAVIFSFFLPVSHAKGYPIVTGVTCTCNFCCFLMCIYQLLEKSKQLCIYLLIIISELWALQCLLFHSLQDVCCLYLLVRRFYLFLFKSSRETWRTYCKNVQCAANGYGMYI